MTRSRTGGDAGGCEAELQVDTFGDSSILATIIAGEDDTAWSRVHALAAWIRAEVRHGVVGATATYRSVLVEFDPLVVTPGAMRDLCMLADRSTARVIGRRHGVMEVPVAYGGEFGPDLADVAASLGLTVASFVDLHTSHEHQIRCLGAPFGAPLLDASYLASPVPRLGSPRTLVAAGSVLMAGRQAGITPYAAPSGWRIVGRTPMRLADISSEPPIRYEAGDMLRFRSISEIEFGHFATEASA